MKKLILGTCLLAASSVVLADEVKDRSGFYSYIGVYDVQLDEYRDMNTSEGYGLGLGFYINKNWAIEGQYTNSDHKVLSQPGADIEFETSGLDLVHFDTSWLGNDSTHPFLKFGVGSYNVKASGGVYNATHAAVEREEFIKVGLGVQHFFEDNVFVRVGYDHLEANTEGDGLAYINLGIFFGDTERGAKPAPVVAPAAPKDSDNDGVIDANDRCPGTPAGARVDSNGCPVDSDGDGVFDYQDACANTPAGAKVDEKGCRVKLSEKVVIDMRLNFDTNKNAIKPEMVAEIAKVAEFLRQYPDVNAEIQGHTDSVGKASYNKSLSQKRADAVAAYLASDFGIDASRLNAVGYGEESPIADNSTSEGRAMNRRAEAHLEAVVEK